MISSILIAGSFPDKLNTNTRIQQFVAEGFNSLSEPPAILRSRFKDVLSTIEKDRPQVCLLIGSCMPDIVDYYHIRKACDKANSRLAFWLHDDPYEFDMSYRVMEAADFIFTNDKWASLHYQHPRVYHLPMAASPTYHWKKASTHQEMDLFFCGVAFPNRISLLRDLKPLLGDFRVLIKGGGWPEDLHGWALNQRMNNDEFITACNNSMATLNIGRNLDLANKRYHLVPSTPGPRTFEAAMSGAVQLFFVESLEIIEYYEPGNEILLFDDPRELREILIDLRSNPEKRYKLAQAAQQRTLQEHTYAQRVASMLNVLEPHL